MPFEREVKLTGPLPDLRDRAELGGARLEFVRLERQRNTYFDSPDGALRARGLTLRLRQLEGGAVFTLKGPSLVRANGLTEREELEAEVEGAAGLEALRDPVILARLAAVASPARLAPLLRLETDRQVYALAGVGELVLDSVRILDGGRRVAEAFTEVELEIEPGVAESTLEAVLAALGELARLEPSRESKFSRAVRVLGLNASNTD